MLHVSYVTSFDPTIIRQIRRAQHAPHHCGPDALSAVSERIQLALPTDQSQSGSPPRHAQSRRKTRWAHSRKHCFYLSRIEALVDNALDINGQKERVNVTNTRTNIYILFLRRNNLYLSMNVIEKVGTDTGCVALYVDRWKERFDVKNTHTPSRREVRI